MNDLLSEMYRKHWTDLQEALKNVDTIGKEISYPLLAYVFPEYEQSNTRIFIIGQQTYGWGFDQRKALFWGSSEYENHPEYLIERIIGIYKGFQLGDKYYKTPFWSASRKLYNSINPKSSNNGFVWSNLVRLDQSQNRPEEDLPVTSISSKPMDSKSSFISISKPLGLTLKYNCSTSSASGEVFTSILYQVIGQGYSKLVFLMLAPAGLFINPLARIA